LPVGPEEAGNLEPVEEDEDERLNFGDTASGNPEIGDSA